MTRHQTTVGWLGLGLVIVNCLPGGPFAGAFSLLGTKKTTGSAGAVSGGYPYPTTTPPQTNTGVRLA